MATGDVGFGFREYWSTAYERYSGFFDEAAQIETLVRRLADAPITPGVLQEKRQLIIVVRSLSLTVCNSLGAVVLLVGNGYGQDALRVARSMLEAAIIVKYLLAVPEKVQGYIDYTWIEMSRQLEIIKEFEPEGYATLSAEALQQVTDGYAKAKKHFAKKSGTGVHSSWAKGVQIAQMAEKADMTQAYDVYYRHASSVVHSDVLSVASTVEPDTLAVRFAPNDSSDARIAAYLAHGTAIDVLRQFNTVAELGFTDEIELRAKQQQQVWGTAG